MCTTRNYNLSIHAIKSNVNALKLAIYPLRSKLKTQIIIYKLGNQTTDERGHQTKRKKYLHTQNNFKLYQNIIFIIYSFKSVKWETKLLRFRK